MQSGMTRGASVPKQWEATVNALSRRIHHVTQLDDTSFQTELNHINGGPAAYMRQHDIPVPKGKIVTRIVVYRSMGEKNASGVDDRFVGQADWNDGHYHEAVYEREDGTQYNVGWCD